jgi:hypothetical protein
MASGRKTGGRKKGVPNKATADVKAAAQKYTAEALKTLAHIMKAGEPDAARVAAAKELLDRGHGRSTQTIDATITDDRMVVRAPEQSASAEEWAGKHGPH